MSLLTTQESVFSTIDQKLSYIVRMLADLKLGEAYDGFLYLADPTRHLRNIHSHHHNELELNVVVQGSITYVVDGRRFKFFPRTLLWLFPRQEHQLVDRSDNAQFYVVVFKPALINKACRTAINEGLKRDNVEQDGVLNTLLSPESFALVRNVMESLMLGSLDPDVLNREAGFGPASDFCFEHRDADALNAGLRYLLLMCWRSQLIGKAVHDPIVLHPVIRRVLKRLSEDHKEESLDELAKACGASKSYLCRKFHQQIGVPLTRYRNSLRLHRFFEQYHQAGQKNITEAVYAAGFGSYAQFYKVFTQAYGRGPRDALATQLAQ
jgi:methylphosphotriester-DNA--protein-cysteine methyltransferase